MSNYGKLIPLIVAPIVAMLTIPKIATAADNVWTSQQDRCSIALPGSGWRFTTFPAYTGPTAQRAPSVHVIVRSPDHSKGVIVTIAGYDSEQELSPEWRAGFDDGYLKQGGQIVSRRDVTIEGRTAYRVAGTAMIKGKQASSTAVNVFSHNRLYSVSAFSLKTDADTDPEINACINSFHLFDPPDAPKPAPAADPHDAAFRAGQAVGRIVGVVMVVVVVLWLLQRLRG